jgi:hypothetical protein
MSEPSAAHRIARRAGVVVAATLAVAAGLSVTTQSGAAATATTRIFAAPSGSGTACSSGRPCAITEAQAQVRAARQHASGPATVVLADGTYRLKAPLQFGAADSGAAGAPVVWTAAPGAHPVLSGATRVQGWAAAHTSGVWAAPVPAGSRSRQLYVDGREAPIAQATPASLHFAGGWHGTSTGYDLSDDPAAQTFFAGLTAEQLRQVEFDYPAGNGAWTDSKCRVDSLAGMTLTMDQPCWTDVTARSSFRDGSGGLPSMDPSQMPGSIQNAAALLHPGQWYLDAGAHTLYYDGANPSGSDVELPRLETLLQGAGTLAAPLHDVTFSGLTFSYATWNAPSEDAGFADVQSNLHMTGAANQGMCTFSTPAGSCPWGLLTEPHANVAFTASNRITLSGNRFVDLGGAGVSFAYGSSDNLVQGNEFTAIASTALLLGCTADPTPVNPDPAHFPDYPTTNPDTPDTIKLECTPDPAAVASDTIGTNEIMKHNTVSDNVVHDIGTDYRSASGITLLFSQHTTVTHNELFDLPYTGITAGVIQGHVDLADHPFNSLNINADNTISENLVHDHLQVLADGGAIYMEGHQAPYFYEADGTTLDTATTLAHGLSVVGNVTYNQGARFYAFYDDAGSEWIHYSGNVEFHPLTSIGAQGGCSPDGHFLIEGNYFANSADTYICNGPVDTRAGFNTAIPATPGPNDVPQARLAAAGPTAAYWPLAASVHLHADYFSPPQQVGSGTDATTQVLIGGRGFTASTPVFFAGRPAAAVRLLSPGFLVATAPSGVDATDVSVGGYVAPPTITSPANGAVGVASSHTVSGTGVDGDTVTVAEAGATVCQGTVAGGTWSCQATGITAGQHTLTAVQSNDQDVESKAVSVVFYVGTPPADARINDTDSGFVYNQLDYSDNRGFGDYQDDLHYATSNGATVTYTFIGTKITVYGEENTDQGDIGIALDGGPQTTVDTVPADGQRHANVAVWSSPTLTPGVHTVVITKLSGSYLTFDGVDIANG